MNQSDHQAIATIALMAALADGTAQPAEQQQLQATLDRLGITNLDGVAREVIAGGLAPADVARKLSDDEARRLAYETALAVCHADGPAGEREQAFLLGLRNALGLSAEAVAGLEQGASALTPPVEVSTGKPPLDPSLDDLILKQAMLAGALELLPQGLASVAILPVQLRLVYQIGQHYGQKLDGAQVRDLAATLGIGAAAQMMEGVVRKVLGGVAGGLLGGLIGGAARMAAGSAVTFAATYALGHAASQYYAQGRRLSNEDLRALYARFQGEAKTIFPKVEAQIRSMAGGLNLKSIFPTTTP
jgi:uncharacterized protein (DUF697 family)/tellurite resistance protein